LPAPWWGGAEGGKGSVKMGTECVLVKTPGKTEEKQLQVVRSVLRSRTGKKGKDGSAAKIQERRTCSYERIG